MAKQKVSYPRVQAAEQYAKDIVSGKIPACKWVKLSCQRHLNDKVRSKSADYPYHFDPAKGEKICKFVENMVHVKAKPWAGTPIKLEPWQCFLLAVPFGWVHKKTDRRRFREIYDEIPRKNAKSTIAAGIGLYMLTEEGEDGAEVYSGATNEKQAWEVFRPAKLMAQKSPGFAEYYGVQVSAKTIHVQNTASRFEALIGKPGDGASPSCAIVDEYHEHQTPELHDTMLTGMGARSQPIHLVITTAGSNLSGPCYDKRQTVCKILGGQIENERIFGIIYTIDDDDDWTDFENWKKANPNYGVSVDEDFLKDRFIEAQQQASKQNINRCKHLNQWMNAKTAWMDMVAWNKCADATLAKEMFQHLPCYTGLDLASRVDVADKVSVYVDDIDGKRHYYVFATHYLPEETIFQPENTHYQGWLNDGWVVSTDGNETDFGRIEEDIVEDSRNFDLKELAFDPWQAASMAQRLAAQGANCIEFRNTVQNMSPAMKEVEAAVLSGRLHHNGDPFLTWMISNVVGKLDKKDNIFPNKENVKQKIDGAVALMMAIGRAMMSQEEKGSVYEKRGIISF